MEDESLKGSDSESEVGEEEDQKEFMRDTLRSLEILKQEAAIGN